MTELWTARVLTLSPEMFPGPLGPSLTGRAHEAGLWRLETRNIRDLATDRHRTVDDTPAGGGAGMVLRADIAAAALDAAAAPRCPVLYLSPRGACNRILRAHVTKSLHSHRTAPEWRDHSYTTN